MGTGIASSASGFAALTLAAAAAAGVELGEPALSALARLGSGSAARSVPGGFVEWRAADAHDESYAWSIAPPDHWDLRDLVAVVSRRHKAVGSTGGHGAASTSPLFQARLAGLEDDLPLVREALLARDMAVFGPAVEAEALSLHAIAMTSRPPVLYWAPETLDLLHRIHGWRADGLPVYFTLDAGPNVHLLCEGAHAPDVETNLAGVDYVEQVLHNRPAGPAVVIDREG
jgi:diphosphomevalonate decarboxylase